MICAPMAVTGLNATGLWWCPAGRLWLGVEPRFVPSWFVPARDVESLMVSGGKSMGFFQGAGVPFRECRIVLEGGYDELGPCPWVWVARWS